MHNLLRRHCLWSPHVSAQTFSEAVDTISWWPLPFDWMPALFLHPCQLLLGACSGAEVAGKESAELGDWHSCWCSFRSLMVWFHTSVSQHFLSAIKFCSCLCQICPYPHRFLGRLIGVTPSHIFYSLPETLFLFS